MTQQITSSGTPSLTAPSVSSYARPTARGLRAGLYARVSTEEQSTENQLLELRRYASSRDWSVVEYVDHGQSGAKETRPALQRLIADARRRRLDVVVCWRLDRLGRNLRHLIVTLDDLTALNVAFVSLGEGIDATTPAGRLQLHLLGAIAEFERARIAERVRAGLDRARRGGQRLGRPTRAVPGELVTSVAQLSIREAAQRLGVSVSTMKRWRRVVQKTPRAPESLSPRKQASV